MSLLKTLEATFKDLVKLQKTNLRAFNTKFHAKTQATISNTFRSPILDTAGQDQKIRGREKDDRLYPKGKRSQKLRTQYTTNEAFLTAPQIDDTGATSITQEIAYVTPSGLLDAFSKLLISDSSARMMHLSAMNNNLQEPQLPCHVKVPTIENSVYELNEFQSDDNFARSEIMVGHTLPTLTLPGESMRRLTNMRWLGFLSQQVYRSGPLGRQIVSQLETLLPSVSEALTMDKNSFSEAVAEAVGMAGQTREGRDWGAEKEALVRAMYPVQIYRLIDTETDDIRIGKFFAISNLERSELPPLVGEWFTLLSQPQKDKPPAARFTFLPLRHYHSTFEQFLEMSNHFFNEYCLHEMRVEGTDALERLKLALEAREYDRIAEKHISFMNSPTPQQKINRKAVRKRLLTPLPSSETISSIQMSEKLKKRLSKDADTFSEAVGQKLLSFAVHHYLNDLRDRQSANDRVGNTQLQKLLVQTSHFPPPAAVIQQAFGINVSLRRQLALSGIDKHYDNIDTRPHNKFEPNSLSIDMQWRLKWLARYVNEENLFHKNYFPTIEEFGKLLETLPLPSRPFLNYLAFCDSAEAGIIDYWWTGVSTADDIDVKWRLNGMMTPQTFADLQYGAAPRQPHSLVATQEALEALSVYLRRRALDLKLIELKVMLVGSSASRWGWFLQSAEKISRSQISSFDAEMVPKLKFVPVAVMPSTFINSEGCVVPECDFLVPSIFEKTGAVAFPFHDADALNKLCFRHDPDIIVCLCMPSGEDWTSIFRQNRSVKVSEYIVARDQFFYQEYLLLGPNNSELPQDASGHIFDTWGVPTFLDKPRLLQSSKLIKNYHKRPAFEVDGFRKQEIPYLSAELIGSLDSPEAVGFMTATSFSQG